MGYSIKQKIEICLLAEANPKMTQLDLAKWCKQQYKQQPSQTTISRILAKKDELIALKEHEFGSIRRRKLTNPLLRKILTEWISQSVWSGIPITAPIIQDTAANVWKSLPEEYRDGNGIFTYKWCTLFLSKMNINISTLDKDLYKPIKIWTFEERDVLKHYLGQIAPQDLFTLDETFLAYNLPLDRSLLKGTEAITVMLCCNVDGSQKLDPLVIGRYENYHCFKDQSPPAKYGITYQSNRQAWLTSTQFYDWLAVLDKRLTRKIYIILDDSSPHRVVNVRLQNVVLIFTNANSKFLPFNWGTLDEFKIRYRIQQYEALISLQQKLQGKVLTLEQGNINMLNAMKLIKKAWESIPVSHIQSNWRSSGILPHYMVNASGSMAFKKNEVLEIELNSKAQQLAVVSAWDYDSLLDLNVEHKNPNFLSLEEILESCIVDEDEPEYDFPPEFNVGPPAVMDVPVHEFNLDDFFPIDPMISLPGQVPSAGPGSAQGQGMHGFAQTGTPGSHGQTPGSLAQIPGSLGQIPGSLGQVPGSLAQIPGSIGQTPGSLSHTQSSLASAPSQPPGQMFSDINFASPPQVQADKEIASALIQVLKLNEFGDLKLSQSTVNELRQAYHDSIKNIRQYTT